LLWIRISILKCYCVRGSVVNVTRRVSGPTVTELYESTETALSECSLSFAVKGLDRVKLQNMTFNCGI